MYKKVVHKIAWKTKTFVKMFLRQWRYYKVSQYYFYKRTKWDWLKGSVKYGWSWTKAYDDLF